MKTSDEADARITEGIRRAARLLTEVFDDPGLLDDIPDRAYVVIADDPADEAAMADVAAQMRAAG